MTPEPNLIELFIAPLNRAGIDYAVTGGLAAVMYGHPRLTLDVDLVIRLGATRSEAFGALWPPDEFYCPPVEVIDAERARSAHGHFNVIHSEWAMRADVYLAGADALQSWALAHHVVRAIQGEQVRFAPIEYVIVNKLRFSHIGGSELHLLDIARILDVSSDTLDRETLNQWLAELGLAEMWARAESLVHGM